MMSTKPIPAKSVGWPPWMFRVKLCFHVCTVYRGIQTAIDIYFYIPGIVILPVDFKSQVCPPVAGKRVKNGDIIFCCESNCICRIKLPDYLQVVVGVSRVSFNPKTQNGISACYIPLHA